MRLKLYSKNEFYFNDYNADCNEFIESVFTGGAILIWWTIPLMLVAGFLSAWPYNYWQLKKYNKKCH